MTMDSCHSDTHYVDAFFFERNTVVEHKIQFYLENEALKMYQRILNKYSGKNKSVLVVMRKVTHELVKSEFLK